MIPPSTQVNKNTPALPELAATMDGVLNIPTPTTIPTMRETASRTDRVFFIREWCNRIKLPGVCQSK
jgi:hypothetical protein